MNKPRETKLSDFEILGKLGQGSFGKVYKAKHKGKFHSIQPNYTESGQICVIKQIDLSKMPAYLRKEAKKEIFILKDLKYKYICRYIDSFVTEKTINIVLEHCEGGDLALLIKKQNGKLFSENDVWNLFIQICLGLNYLHQKKIIHRDIKTQNIFIAKDGSVRIGDLGVAKNLAQTNVLANTVVGTPYYLSPELCEEKPYNHKSDIWSLGCVLYELCTLKHPFNAMNQGALIFKILQAKFTPISTSIYGPHLAEIIQEMLTKDYKKRPSLPDILKKPIVIQKARGLGLDIPDDFNSKKYNSIQDVINEKENKSNQNQQILKPVLSKPQVKLEDVYKVPSKAQLKQNPSNGKIGFPYQEKKASGGNNSALSKNFASPPQNAKLQQQKAKQYIAQQNQKGLGPESNFLQINGHQAVIQKSPQANKMASPAHKRPISARSPIKPLEPGAQKAQQKYQQQKQVNQSKVDMAIISENKSPQQQQPKKPSVPSQGQRPVSGKVGGAQISKPEHQPGRVKKGAPAQLGRVAQQKAGQQKFVGMASDKSNQQKRVEIQKVLPGQGIKKPDFQIKNASSRLSDPPAKKEDPKPGLNKPQPSVQAQAQILAPPVEPQIQIKAPPQPDPANSTPKVEQKEIKKIEDPKQKSPETGQTLVDFRLTETQFPNMKSQDLELLGNFSEGGDQTILAKVGDQFKYNPSQNHKETLNSLAYSVTDAGDDNLFVVETDGFHQERETFIVNVEDSSPVHDRLNVPPKRDLDEPVSLILDRTDDSFDVNSRIAPSNNVTQQVENLMDEEEKQLYQQEKMGLSDFAKDKQELTKQGWVVIDDQWDDNQTTETESTLEESQAKKKRQEVLEKEIRTLEDDNDKETQSCMLMYGSTKFHAGYLRLYDKLQVSFLYQLTQSKTELDVTDVEDLMQFAQENIQGDAQEEETKSFFEKLSKYIGSNIKFLIDRDDGDFVFRLHKSRVYYISAELIKLAGNVGRDQLISIATNFGKFTKSGQFRLQITCLDFLAKYAKYKVWVKPSGEQSYLYGNHVLKSHLARITENAPKNAGVIIYSMSDIPLGFGISAKSTQECRDLDPTAIVAINQCDIGEYLRSEEEF